MFKTVETLEVGDQFKIVSADSTIFTYLGQEQVGGMHDDTRVVVWARPSWDEYGKASFVTFANLPVALVRRNAFAA